MTRGPESHFARQRCPVNHARPALLKLPVPLVGLVLGLDNPETRRADPARRPGARATRAIRTTNAPVGPPAASPRRRPPSALPVPSPPPPPTRHRPYHAPHAPPAPLAAPRRALRARRGRPRAADLADVRLRVSVRGGRRAVSRGGRARPRGRVCVLGGGVRVFGGKCASIVFTSFVSVFLLCWSLVCALFARAFFRLTRAGLCIRITQSVVGSLFFMLLFGTIQLSMRAFCVRSFGSVVCSMCSRSSRSYALCSRALDSIPECVRWSDARSSCVRPLRSCSSSARPWRSRPSRLISSRVDLSRSPSSYVRLSCSLPSCTH